MVRVVLVEEFAVELERLEFALRTVPGLALLADSAVEDAIGHMANATALPDVLVAQHNGSEGDEYLLDPAGTRGVRRRVLVTVSDNNGREREHLKALGVAGTFDRQIPVCEFLDAIRQLADVQGSDGRTNGHRQNRALSNQEQRAAELVLEGLANKEIAGQMEISESSVKALLQRVFLKLGVRTRGQLVRFMLESTQAAPQALEQASGASG